MNKAIKEIFDTYNPLLAAINDQIAKEIALTHPVFKKENFISAKYNIITKNIKLKIPENKEYNFKVNLKTIYDTVTLESKLLINNKKISQTLNLDLALKDTTGTELYIDRLTFDNFKILEKDDITISVYLDNKDAKDHLTFSFEIYSKDINFSFEFDNLSREKENYIYNEEYKGLKCPIFISYVDKYRKLFNLYEFEEEAVSEILLKNKPFTQEQKDLFKLLYDFDSFDTKDLSINLMPEHKLQSLKNNI